MTDKQIIIDGIDVSGCEFYNKDDKTCREANGKYNIDICDFDKCESSNCCYKQLKRKEQECKELKEDRERWKSNFNGKVSAIGELLQQLDQLKAKNIKIYKTLTEIKGIAEENIRIADLEGLNGVYRRGLAEQIIKKISEYEREINERSKKY